MRNRILTIPIVILLIILTVSPLFILNASAAAVCRKCGYAHSGSCTTCSTCGLPQGPNHHLKSYDGTYRTCQPCPICSTSTTHHIHNYGNIKKSFSAMAAWDFVCKAYNNLSDSGTPGKDNVAEMEFEKQQGISVADLIKLDRSSGGFEEAFRATETAYNSLSLIGFIMVFIYFMMELFEMSIDNKLEKEQVAKLFIKTLIGFLIIKNGYSIMLMAVAQAEEIVTTIGTYSAFKNPGEAGTCYGALLQNTSMIDELGIMLDHIMPSVVGGICFFIIRIIAWTRIFDILIRMTFAPIGLADFIRGGSKSNAVRYLKKFLGSCLQGACLIATLAAYDVIADSVRHSVSGWIGSILVALAVITAMKQTGKIANEVLGD